MPLRIATSVVTSERDNWCKVRLVVVAVGAKKSKRKQVRVREIRKIRKMRKITKIRSFHHDTQKESVEA